jgi:chromosome segregation ATPase
LSRIQLQDCQSELARQQSTIVQLTADLANRNSTIATSTQELENVNNNLTSKITKLTHANSMLQASLTQFQQEYTNVRAEKGQQQRYHAHQAQQLTFDQEAAWQAAKNQHDQLVEQLSQQHVLAITEIKERHDQTIEELTNKHALEVADLKELKDKLSQALEASHKLCEKVATERDTATLQGARLARELEESKDGVRGCYLQLDSVKQLVESLQAELDTAANNDAQNAIATARLQAQYDQTMLDYQSLMDVVQRGKKETEALVKRLTGATQQQQRCIDQLQHALACNDDLEVRCEKAEAKFSQQLGECKQSTTKIDRLLAKLETMRESLTEYEQRARAQLPAIMHAIANQAEEACLQTPDLPDSLSSHHLTKDAIDTSLVGVPNRIAGCLQDYWSALTWLREVTSKALAAHQIRIFECERLHVKLGEQQRSQANLRDLSDQLKLELERQGKERDCQKAWIER